MRPGPSGIACSFPSQPLDMDPGKDGPVHILHASLYEPSVWSCSRFLWTGDLFAVVAGRGFALAGHVGVGDGNWEGSIWSRLAPGVSVFDGVHVMNSSSLNSSSLNRSGGNRKLAGETDCNAGNTSPCGEYRHILRGASCHINASGNLAVNH